MINQKIPLSVAIGVSALLTACASSPPENEAVSEARSAYQAIADDPHVARSANTYLRNARDKLEEAEELLEEGEDDELVEHEAYLASGYAGIAAARGERSRIQEEIQKAESRRDQLELESRSAATRRAQNEAQLAQQEAEELRRQMEELKELQAQETDRGMVLTLGDVLFETDKATLQGTADRTIVELAKFMEKYEDRRVRVEGYTDSTGSEEYNQQLSQKRAEAVRSALLNQGISSDRIEVQGFGEAYPVASNDDATGRQRNRRVEIVISDEEGQIETR